MSFLDHVYVILVCAFYLLPTIANFLKEHEACKPNNKGNKNNEN